MHYKLSAELEPGKPYRLVLSGFLNIRNAQALHAELLGYAKKQEGIYLQIREVEDLDVACLQILLSLHQYQQQQKHAFSLEIDVKPALNSLIQTAGINQTLTTYF